MRLATALAIAMLPCVASAGILDDTEDLQGKTIAYAGDFEQVICPVGGKYNCLQWPMGFLKATKGAEFCFVTDAMLCSYNCKGLIAVGSDRQPAVYVFETIGGGMKKGSFRSYKCPSPF